MGVAVVLHALDDARLESIFAYPPLLMRLIAPDDPEAMEMMESRLNPGTGLGRFFGFGKKSPRPQCPDVEFTEDEVEGTDLDKAWQAVHFLMTGSAEDGPPPLNFLTAGGRVVPGSDNGLGLARAFTAPDTRTIADAMSSLGVERAAARYDAKEMSRLKLYPEIWDRPESKEYALENLERLFEFVATAAAEKKGLAVYYS